MPGIGLTYVGTHWFAYADQSATGKISREKPAVHGGIGLVDVTDTPYPELATYNCGPTNIMYSLADKEAVDLLRVLEETWRLQFSTR